MTDDEISELYNKFKDKEKMVTIYHYFRMSVSGVVESIIILDRLLYILENVSFLHCLTDNEGGRGVVLSKHPTFTP